MERGWVINDNMHLDSDLGTDTCPPSATIKQFRESGRQVAGGGKPTPKAMSLSLRQEQVLELLSQGKTMRETSHQLGLSFCTVNTHMRRLYKKLGVRNRTCAVNEFNSRKTAKMCPLCGCNLANRKPTVLLEPSDRAGARAPNKRAGK